MMVVDRNNGTIVDSNFNQLPNYLRAGDVLVINDTRVMRARMFGVLERTNGSSRPIELLFVEPVSTCCWKVLCKPGRRVRPGDRVILEKGAGIGLFGEAAEQGLHQLTVESSVMSSVVDLLANFGQVPLPPYLERNSTESDSAEYQTIFAKKVGAIAAPTAGLHFTPTILNSMTQRGVHVVPITLNVGIGTFLPIRTVDPRKHVLRPEWFSISTESAQHLNKARESGRRIIGVGTTSARTLEHLCQSGGEFQATSGYADMYILPGHKFGAVDCLLTNFHLPRSTLLMLVSAFATRELILKAYARAIGARYRFYSYGDCMLVL